MYKLIGTIMFTHTHIHIVPLVLKKHSPLLYTEKHGTLALRNKSNAKSSPPAVFAISGRKKKAKHRLEK